MKKRTRSFGIILKNTEKKYQYQQQAVARPL